MRLMNSPLAPVLPTGLIALRYTAHNGATVVLPVLATRSGRHLAVLVGDAHSKRWWHHFVGQASLEIFVDGQWTTGRAAVKVGASTPVAGLYADAHPDRRLDYSSVLLSIVLDAPPDAVLRASAPQATHTATQPADLHRRRQWPRLQRHANRLDQPDRPPARAVPRRHHPRSRDRRLNSMTTQPATTDATGVWRAIHWGFVALFGAGAFVHVFLALTRSGSYRPFADAALFGWVYTAWQDIFMAHPTLWALLLAAAELTIAVLLVKAPRAGYVAVVAFHLALMLFGWGFWLWSVPALAVAIPATRHAFRADRDHTAAY